MKGIAFSILTGSFFIAASIDPPTKDQMDTVGPFLFVCLGVTVLTILVEGK